MTPELIEKMKNNKEAFMFWPTEIRNWAMDNKKEFVSMRGHSMSDVCSFCNDTAYRLRPDYVEPPKERWFVCIADGVENGALRFGINYFPKESWLELKTPEELAYVKDRPEGCRFGKPIGVCQFMTLDGRLVDNDIEADFPPNDLLSGYRWIKDAPKEEKPTLNKEIETLIHEMFVDAEKKLNDAIRARFEVVQ